MTITFKSCLIVFLLLLLQGCSKERLDKEIRYPNLPQSYNKNEKDIQVDKNWKFYINDIKLIELIDTALNKNFSLQQLEYDIKIKEQELISAKSFLFPSLDASISGSESGTFEESGSIENISGKLDLSYTVDIWGQLSDSQKKANINLLTSKALYEETKQQLIADVALLYYEIIESNKLLDLYKKNEKNSLQYYELISSRYKQGLNTALDTYLAKNSIYNQQIKITTLKTQKAQAIYKLEQMLGSYPKGTVKVASKFPLLNKTTKLGVPSDLILKRASLNTAWNTLLLADYQLAITHKQRLPSLSLSASLEDTKNNGTPIVWSLLGNLTAPIFSAGRLKANEEIAYFELKKVELHYLDTVYNAFVEIENLREEEKNLLKEYEIIERIDLNAKKSLSLSFNEYSKGLVEYSTVLNLQESHYNAEASLIQKKRQLIQNKIELYKVLGGKFLFEENKGIKKDEI